MTSILRTLDALEAAHLITSDERVVLEPVADRYAIGVTETMARLIDSDNPSDPIRRQFIPDIKELTVAPEELSDPIGDAAHSPLQGIVHRYPDRVLLKLTHICPVYCRFCFRREMVGPGRSDALSETAIDAAMAYIADHKDIWEVIITGGDPLILSPRRLSEISKQLSKIDHVRIVRWHSRVPVVDPESVTEELTQSLHPNGKSTWLAIHANHPKELTPESLSALQRLRRAGLNLISQTVLLKGVNDSVDTLSQLMKAFVEAGIKPYYLHQGDFARGTAHWRTSVEEGKTLIDGLRGRLSGLAQPTYVIDLPGGYGKVPIAPLSCDVEATGWRIKDWQGNIHHYSETNKDKQI